MRRLLFFLLLMVCTLAARGQVLIPYTDGERWGYADTAGRLVLPVQWSSATFFDGDRAIVGIPAGGASGPYSALINRRGEYIIPPSRRWTGQWEGFGNTRLNTSDTAGRMGLVDTANRLLIPYGFEALRVMVDSAHRHRFVMLSKHGLWGVMNAAGEMTVQPQWKALAPLDGGGGPVAFQAFSDSGSALLDSDGRVATLAVFNEFRWERSSTVQGFVASRSVRSGGAEEYRSGFVEYPSGRLVIPAKFRHVKLTPHGYFIVSNDSNEVAVMDSGGVVRLPFSRQGYYASGDTIFQIHYLNWRDDSTISQVRHFDGHTLRPLAGWHRQAAVGFFSAIGNENFCGTGRAMAAQLEQGEAMRPTIIVNGRPVKKVEIAGIKWYTQKFANWPARLYAVYGRPVAGDPSPLVAVLDTCLRLQFSPVRNQGSIVHYNPEAGLVVYQAHGDGNKTFWRVADTTGRVMLTQAQEIVQTVVAGAKLYLIQRFPQDWRSSTYKIDGELLARMCDTAGHLIPELAAYQILAPVSNWGANVTTNSSTLHVKDTLRRQGFVDVSGKIVWPGVSFLQARLQALGSGLFFLSNYYHTEGFLADTTGRDVAPALRVISVNRTRAYPFFSRQGHGREVPGVWMVSYQDRVEPARRGVFYLHANGTVFTNGFEKRAPHGTGPKRN